MMLNDGLSRLEAVMRVLTVPEAGQYPRPWMTSLTDPSKARVFTVGKNQARKYSVTDVGSHQRYLDALFNRGAESCRALYDRLHPKPSPTRKNTDMLVRRLAERGIPDVVETNVICFSTSMSRDLLENENLAGAAIGREIFAALYNTIRPRIIVAHGAGTIKELGRFLGADLPAPPKSIGTPVRSDFEGVSIFSVPSLAPPKFNSWQAWSKPHLDEVADTVREILGSEER